MLGRRLRQREVFVPLRHDPGHAQADFGEALAEIAGVEPRLSGTFFAVQSARHRFHSVLDVGDRSGHE